MNEDFLELIRTLSEKDIRRFFQEKLDRVYLGIGQLSKDELTTLQERVNVYVEMREEFISIRNTKPSKK